MSATTPQHGPGPTETDNTRQFRWIVVLFDNLTALFRERADVFVGANLVWYPVQGQPAVRAAPSVLVAFGRPKGDRASYKQWEEGGVPVTVVFHVLSPQATGAEWMANFAFYDDHGVEEYYLYDPARNRLAIYVRREGALVRVRRPQDFVSPRLGIRFDLSGPAMIVRRHDGQPFLSFEELQRAQEDTEQRAQEERWQRLEAEQRTARLAELSRKARRQQATPEELAELERLEEPPSSLPS